jgi:hypothetical protein
MSPKKFNNLVFEFLIKLSESNEEEILAVFTNGFKNLYDISVEGKYFWRFCPFSVYENTFSQRYEIFSDRYPANKIEFANEELSNIYKNYQDHKQDDSVSYPNPDDLFFVGSEGLPYFAESSYLYTNLNHSDYKLHYYNDKRKIEFLENIINKNEKPEANINQSSIEWKGSSTDFIRLCKALVESPFVKSESQKSLINNLASLFSIEIKNDGKKELETITNVQGTTNEFVFDKLKIALKKWVIDNDEKKENRK